VVLAPYKDLGDLARAQATCERALAIWQRFQPPDNPHIASVKRSLERL
jgi:hypothetical protein